MGKRGREQRKPVFTDIIIWGFVSRRDYGCYHAQEAAQINIPLNSRSARLPLEMHNPFRFSKLNVEEYKRHCWYTYYKSPLWLIPNSAPKQLSRNTKIKLFLCKHNATDHTCRHLSVTGDHRFVIASKERSSSFPGPDRCNQLKGKTKHEKKTW